MMQIDFGWDKAAFALRLEEVIGKIPVSVFAKKCEIAEGMLRKYLRAESIPGSDKLVRISAAGGVCLLWMATGRGPKYPQEDWDHISPSQLAVVMEFERFAQRRPGIGENTLIQDFVEQYNTGVLDSGPVGDIARISKGELLLWRNLAWEKNVVNTSIDEGTLQASIEIADELLKTTDKHMEPAEKARLIAAIYQLNVTTEGGVERSMLLNLLKLIS